MNGNQEPPVNVGDELEVEIESVGEKGDGIAKVEGFVLFVPGTKKGDRVKIKVSKVLKSVGFADKVGKVEKKESEELVEEEAPMPEPEEEKYENTETFGEDEE